MEISGKIIAVLPIATGQGKNGTWRSQDYVLETADQYPKKVCFNLFGDKIDQFPIAIDDQVNVSFDVESREYNGRWYTTVRAWKIEKNVVSASAAAPSSFSAPAPSFDAAPGAGEGSDLPF
ncbi:MAG: DUF3127 domain-containing protein [Paludibacter sp.]|nr:DUF3127 domain-containing protein [Paludibacter sp.]